MAKAKKEIGKKEGKDVNGAAMSHTNEMPQARQLNRGLGSAYAVAVTTVLDAAGEISGSKNPFLGVKSELLDPAEYGAHSLLHGPGRGMKHGQGE
jgi:hypothetical protein